MNSKKFIGALFLLLSFASFGQRLRTEQTQNIGNVFGLQPRAPTVLANWNSKKVYFYGDSYVVGVGVATASLRATSLVCNYCHGNEQNHGVNSSVITTAIGNISGCGANRPVFDTSTIATYNSSTDTLLFIHFGFNDVYTNETTHSVPDSFSYSYQNAVKNALAKGWPPAQIVCDAVMYQRNAAQYVGVCNVTTEATDARAQQYTDTIRTICQRYGLVFMDIRSRQQQVGNIDSLVYSADGIHPDTAGHALWAAYWSNASLYIPMFDSAVLNMQAQIPTMPLAHAIAFNNFVMTLKNANIWNKMKSIAPVYWGGGSGNGWLQYAKITLKGPYLINHGVGKITTGFVGQPGSKFGLDMGFKPTDFTNGGVTMIMSCRTDVQEPKLDMGTVTPNFSLDICAELRDNSNVCTIHGGGGTLSTFSNTSSIGVYAFVATPTTLTSYKGGSQVDTKTSTYAFTDTYNFFIGNGDSGANPGSKTYGLCALGDPLTSGEVSTLSTAIQTLETALGR